jgi:membrane-associated protease RseP (regulator of RpoE activity)
MAFWQEYKWVILFYSAIVLLIYIFRKKFDVQHKVMAFYRTKVGLKLMERWGKKYCEQIKLLGYIGIGAGYIGLFVIIYFMLKNLITLLSVPTATTAISVVIPGVKIPGSPVTIPLIIGWIALFIVILVHEFSHGIVAKAHGLEVKSSGIFFLGPLMGAFVEPDEAKLRKEKDTVQYSVYAAGPFSNMLLALACIILLTYAFSPALGAMADETGVDLAGVTDGYPAKAAGLEQGMVVSAVNNVTVKNYNDFTNQLRYVRPNDSVTITANGTDYALTTVASPNDPKQGYLGVMAASKPHIQLKSEALYYQIFYAVLKWIVELLAITGLLSLGIGLANLLPLGPVDGGRMLQVSLQKIKGEEKGNKIWHKISIATLLLLAINIFWPAIKWFGKLLIR